MTLFEYFTRGSSDRDLNQFISDWINWVNWPIVFMALVFTWMFYAIIFENKDENNGN